MPVSRFTPFVFFLLAALFSASSASAAQEQIKIYTAHDGLAGDYITAIFPVQEGELWVGTTEGATHISDTGWVSYTRAHGLGDSWITDIAVAPDERVWFGTHSGGVSVLDPVSKTIATYNLDNSAIPSNFVTKIARGKNQIWVGTLDKGIAVLDLAYQTWTRYDFPKSPITFLKTDSDNRVYVGTESDGAFIFERGRWNPLDVPLHGKIERIEFEGDGCPIVVTLEGSACPNHPLDNYLNPYYQNAQTVLNLTQGQITALAGSIVGTANGLYVLSDDLDTISPVRPLPTVLIHGWTVAGDDTLATSEFRFLKSYADRDGIPMYYARGVSPKNTLYQNAQIIRDEIARVKQETGADKVNLIGFSMGGMNTRAYLESSLYANDVNRAIILGTPQAGVDIWKPILVQQILQKPDEPSAIELSPEYAQLAVNPMRLPNADVPYDLLIGDAREQAALDFLDDMPASDALISVSSALSLDAPNVRKHVNADLHDWGPEAVPLDLTGYLYPRETWERYLRNALRNGDKAPLGSEILPSSITSGAGGEVWTSNHTPVVTEKIRAGETVTRTVLLDENKSARFIAYYPGGKMDFSLVAPDGKKFESSDLPRKDGSGVLSLSTDIANFSGYVVKNAPAGEWQMILKRTDTGDKPVAVSTYVELNAPLRLEAFPDWGGAKRGEPTTLRALVRAYQAAETAEPTSELLRGVKMRARIAQPAESSGAPFTFSEIELYDDGQHHDGEANDGIFANAFTPTRAGWHAVSIQALGKNFLRETEMLFPVNAGDVTLAPQITVRFDSDVQARRDTIALEAGVTAARGGRFGLMAQLRPSDSGRVLARQFVPIELSPGTSRVPIRLEMPSLPSGDYAIDLKLLDANWAAFELDSRPQIYTFARP